MLQSREEEEETAVRKATYPIDSLFLNRWSPRSMTGEELDDNKIMTLLKQQDGRHPLLTINLGDSYMLREIPNTGIEFLIFCLKEIKNGQVMLLY
jgi:hypothetical protein